eukprot:Seg514.5 transcript_id=Seg514.5/GoldUCD/mRNA.D3Y31 product="Chromatin target of PRMT1 protein" protein_id=Seg514.5/GoldUCD/D3Y31
MSSSSLSKVVLKSTTTMTLSDRFTDIMKMKSPKGSSVQHIRTERAQTNQASAKNKRLAEQMSRRTGLDADPQQKQVGSIKNRLGLSTKARLGAVPRGRGRGTRGISRGRGTSSQRSGFSPTRGGRGSRARGTRGSRGGSFRGSRGTGRGYQSGGRGRGRGGFRGRGRGSRGGQTGGKPSREALDSELDSYMSVGKKEEVW